MERRDSKCLIRALFAALVLLTSLEKAAAEHAVANHAKHLIVPTLIAYKPEIQISGRMTIAGSDTMQPILTRLAMEFRRWHPEAKIAVQGSRNHQESTELPLVESFLDGFANSRRGDGKTSGHFGSNDVRLLAVSRQLTREEIKEFVSRFGYLPTAIPIAQDAVAVYVHHDNPIAGLTLEQLDAIFSKSRRRGSLGELLTWGQAGLENTWHEAPIHLYGRDKRSTGTRPFFKHVALLDGEFKESLREEPGSASVVLAVARDPRGIGYSGIGFHSSGVREVPLAEKSGMPFVQPTQESVMKGSYPLARQLYLYVNKAPQKALDQKTLEFLKFVNSQAGQTAVTRAGVYPLTATQIAKNLEVLTGTSVAVADSSSSGETRN
ncbi:MAG: PstS family phosphate ABC transporter substrate-binding protein [Nitrospiraceae bacterium]